MRIHRLLSKGQLYDAEILQDAMRSNLGDITFQEAFNRTRWILNITVSSSTVYDMPRLLNYLTAPDVVSFLYGWGWEGCFVFPKTESLKQTYFFTLAHAHHALAYLVSSVRSLIVKPCHQKSTQLTWNLLIVQSPALCPFFTGHQSCMRKTRMATLSLGTRMVYI